jgi:hypothetical protein
MKTILSPTVDTAYVHAGRRLLLGLIEDGATIDEAAADVADFLTQTVETYREVAS